MYRQYFLEKINLIKEKNRLYGDIDYLNNFLKDYESYFKSVESITALNNIKKHLELLNLNMDLTVKNIKNCRRKISELCNHELLIKNGTFFQYKCPICKNLFKLDKINFNCIILESDNYVDMDEFYMILYNIFSNNQNIVNDFEKYIDNDKNEKIRIYRRIYEKK